MPLIDKPATYRVTLRNPAWQRMEAKDGDNARMQAVLPGYCEVGGEEQHINGYLYFTRQLIGSGKNQGRSAAEVNSELLLSLGMSAPFEPSKITEMDGAEVEFVCENDTYQGETRLKVKWINPVGGGKPPITGDEADALFAEMCGNVAAPQAAVEGAAASEEDDDDLPF